MSNSKRQLDSKIWGNRNQYGRSIRAHDKAQVENDRAFKRMMDDRRATERKS